MPPGMPSNGNTAIGSLRRRPTRSTTKRTARRTHFPPRLRKRHAYVYLESPCNPHGYVLDVPGICQAAHAAGLRVLLDATVGTPFLTRPLQRRDPAERPDFVIHSYTKDLTGTGSAIAGVVIGRNEDMFIPKGQTAAGKSWEQTLFWNVYYVKGGFLHADVAFEVLQGIRTLDVRMLAKCINTIILARFLASHPAITVHCNALADDPNAALCRRSLFLGLPAPLFTIDMATLPRPTFQRYFDALDPDLRPHDQPRAIEYDRELSRPDDPFRAERGGATGGRDQPHDDSLRDGG